ncbi:interferon alpha-inducible protein 27-like protein 2A isoform X1 [Strigops habroptila]|uniref:interferon alpha-inducible protein 27-like protein 2A isoform X1 n=1 Tax=Strigops habroptila TaxID=2489341 RepID=UPI0011CFF35B|nr:interferon alpha-inducible protein 27-like protein 2A isoform X1 [Strigops habroptila]
MKGKHRHRPRIPGKQNPAELFLGNPLSSRQPRPRRVRNPPHWPLDQQTDRKKLFVLAPKGPGSAQLSLQRLPPRQPAMELVGPAIGAAVGIGLSLVVVPAALYALGFTTAGIAAGSVAARMMSLAATANGGRVAAGSLVAIGQSLGAAGLPTSVKAILSALGAVIGAIAQ